MTGSSAGQDSDAALRRVVGGVDTHQDTHTAAVLDATGAVLGCARFPVSPAGYRALHRWVARFGTVVAVGVEGTGAYGAGLTRFLHAQGVRVVEVDRPERKTRRWQGKSDPVDAQAAARAVLAGARTGTPKQTTGPVEAVRVLRVARRSAVRGRADAIRQLKMLLITAPESLRAQLGDLRAQALIQRCATMRPDPTRAADPGTATVITLRSLARRYQVLTTEIADLDALLEDLVTQINPALLAINGVGVQVAAQLLVSAGQNAHRITSEAAFAMLCGAAPIPASSGKTTRHRLNRGGDRQANAALYTIVLSRLRWDPATTAYVEKRTNQGRTKAEIIRCLKRYVAREVYATLTHNTTQHTPSQAA